MTDRMHHPQCQARYGGACTSCPMSPRLGAPKAHEPDIVCRACGQEYLIAAETELAREGALRDWPGCDCTQDTLRPGGPVLNAGEELPGRGVTKQQGLARWVSGVPAFVRRRQAVAW